MWHVPIIIKDWNRRNVEIILFILTNNILPIFILVILGYLVSRKFDLNILTLTKLNFFIFVPIFIFSNLYTTKLSFEMLKAFVIAVLILLANLGITMVVSKIRHYPVGMKNAFANSVMFYNSGNIGLPLVTLVFSSAPFVVNGETPYLSLALTVQIMIMVFQNITLNTIGFINAGRAKTHWKKSVLQLFKMPIIYMIPLALLLKLVPCDITKLFFWPAIRYASNALVPIALITLGVQLSKTKMEIRNKEVYLSNFLRLIGGPLIALAFILLIRLDGVVAQTLMISTAVPTAVNSALIAVEKDNHPDFASQVVLSSTLLCAVTLVFVIYLARTLFPVV